MSFFLFKMTGLVEWSASNSRNSDFYALHTQPPCAASGGSRATSGIHQLPNNSIVSRFTGSATGVAKQPKKAEQTFAPSIIRRGWGSYGSS